MSAASASKSVTEIKRKKRELSFHSYFIYEGFTSLHLLINKLGLPFSQLSFSYISLSEVLITDVFLWILLNF